MLHISTTPRTSGLPRRALLWNACAVLLLGGLAWGLSPGAHAASSATVVEAVQLPACQGPLMPVAVRRARRFYTSVP